jgi:hypothetical protein
MIVKNYSRPNSPNHANNSYAFLYTEEKFYKIGPRPIGPRFERNP